MQYQLCAFEAAFGEETGNLYCRSFFQGLACFCQLTHHHRVYFTLHFATHAGFHLFRCVPDDKTQYRDACRGEAQLFHLEQLAMNDQ